ncbi:MAG: gliding motility-associated C-terminal domain-containing protein [Bacteroidales bacterium]|nr:gliding motility-associated C-terminal domain-containing protein [Bacteroidales bacterium]
MKSISIFIFAVIFTITAYAQHFSIDPSNGCGSAEVSFTNLHPSEGYTPQMFITTGFNYQWDFGNGNTSTSENPAPEMFDGPGEYQIQYTVTIDTIGFELSKIVLDGYLGCTDPEVLGIGGDVDVYIELYDNNSNLLISTEDDADSYQVDPEENNQLEFSLGSLNIGSSIPLWLKIMDSDSADADDNCIDDGEGDGTMIAIQLPPNNADGFFETTKVIETTTPNGDLTITAYFNKPVLILSQTLTVDVFPLPGAPSVDNQNLNLCVGSEMPVIEASGDNIEWYDDEELANLIHSGNDFTPNLETEDSIYTFYVTQTDNINSCTSAATVVTIDYGTMASPTMENYASSYCYGQIMPDFVAIGENINWYSDENLENLINSGNTLEVSNYDVGEHTYYFTQSNSEQTCVSETAELSFTVIDAIQANITSTDVSCFGGSDGTASVEIIAGDEPFAFNWSDGSTSQNLTNAEAGDYTVTIRDNNFCLLVLDAVIGSPNELNIVTTVESGFCPYHEVGRVTAIVTGGTGNYSYQWSNGSQDDFADTLTETFYTLTVTDENSCQKTAEVEIEQTEDFVISKIITKASCPDNSDGVISISTTGGTAPYEFYWENGVTDTIVENLSAGTYSITITDFKGCTHTENIDIDNTYSICLVPASVLTPNNDGKNDYWKIMFIEMHPQAEVFVYSRAGQLVFNSTGYNSDWDGTNNGKVLPTGSYLYIIDLKDNSDPMRGYIDIIR